MSRHSEVCASLSLILANKYKGGPSTSDPESRTMKAVLDFWGSWLKTEATSSSLESAIFESINAVAMNTLAGATARQDKSMMALVPVLTEAIASEPHGDIVARSMGILVRDSDLLSAENHAVVKRFYKQWAYSQIVKPLYPLALPTKDGPSTAAKYRTAVLSVVSSCAFSVYEADVEPLMRLLITALGDRATLSGQQLASALEVLVEILSNEPDALKSHLKAIIEGAMGVYEGGLPGTGTTSRRDPSLTSSRKLVLQVLGAVPKKFEERHLLPYSPKLQRMLALACGDPVREVRQVARLARASWAKVV